MKTKLIFSLLFISTMVGCFQPLETIEKTGNPIIDSTLVVSESYCKYTDSDVYIINSDYVIYENCHTRKYLYPDMKSFHIPSENSNNFFALDKNGVYFRGKFIPTDTTEFKVIGNNHYNRPVLWKTKTQMYQNTTPIKVSDETLKTIECLSYNYLTDKDFLYYFDTNLEKIENADVSSMEVGGDVFSENSFLGVFCYDKNNVYWKGKAVTFDNEKVTPINNFLFKTSKYVLKRVEYASDLQFKIIPEIDPKTIKKLSKYIAMDSQYIYYKTEKLPILPNENIKIWEQNKTVYLSDGKNIYNITSGKKTNFDAQYFDIVPDTELIYYKNNIYYKKKDNSYIKIPFRYTQNFSPKDIFENYPYIIYKKQVYNLENNKLENLTDEEIAFIKEGKSNYGINRKNNKIYWKNRETIADAESFQKLNYDYCYKDKNRVYYYDNEKGLITIEGIDAQSVELFNNQFIKDKNYIYIKDVDMINKTYLKLFKSENIELLAIFQGNRSLCSIDTDYYLFRNVEGYWLVYISENDVIMRNLGKELPENWNENFSDGRI